MGLLLLQSSGQLHEFSKDFSQIESPQARHVLLAAPVIALLHQSFVFLSTSLAQHSRASGSRLPDPGGPPLSKVCTRKTRPLGIQTLLFSLF